MHINFLCSCNSDRIESKKYYSSGQIEEIKIVKNGKIISKKSFHKDGWITSSEQHDENNNYLLTFKPNGDTFSFSNDYEKYYNFMEYDDRIENIVLVNSGKIIGGIQFDSTGSLIQFDFNKNLLNSSDSLRLTKDHPDWQKQIKAARELKEKNYKLICSLTGASTMLLC